MDKDSSKQWLATVGELGITGLSVIIAIISLLYSIINKAGFGYVNNIPLISVSAIVLIIVAIGIDIKIYLNTGNIEFSMPDENIDDFDFSDTHALEAELEKDLT